MKRLISLMIIFPVSLLSYGCSSLPLKESSTNSNYSPCDQQSSALNRNQYQPVSLNQFQEKEETDLIGNNPKNLVLERFGFSQIQESQKQELTAICTKADQLIVILTKTGLLDDSVAGIRYYVELNSLKKGWQVTWAGQQQKCHPQRGHTDWSTELCL